MIPSDRSKMDMDDHAPPQGAVGVAASSGSVPGSAFPSHATRQPGSAASSSTLSLLSHSVLADGQTTIRCQSDVPCCDALQDRHHRRLDSNARPHGPRQELPVAWKPWDCAQSVPRRSKGGPSVESEGGRQDAKRPFRSFAVVCSRCRSCARLAIPPMQDVHTAAHLGAETGIESAMARLEYSDDAAGQR